jgi:hypothetical protein
VRKKGGCHIPSCDYYGIGDREGVDGRELSIEKEVVVEVMELVFMSTLEATIVG